MTGGGTVHGMEAQEGAWFGLALLASSSNFIIEVFSSFPLGYFGERNRISFYAVSSVLWLLSFLIRT